MFVAATVIFHNPPDSNASIRMLVKKRVACRRLVTPRRQIMFVAVNKDIALRGSIACSSDVKSPIDSKVSH